MPHVIRRLIVTLVLLPSVLRAQAPVITPAGDPSVQADTIYRLAVNPADHQGERWVLLLDDGVLRYEADGTGTRTYRTIVQVLQQDAVETWAEHEFSYAPGHEKLTVNWIRVVRPDGTVISETPTQVQESDVPATMGNPVYADRKVLRYSLAGVAPGVIVDFSYTTEERKPFLAGDFHHYWRIHTGAFVRRSRYIVDLPASLTPHLLERNLTITPVVKVANGRRVTMWAAQDLPKPRSEEFAADSNNVWMTVILSGARSWADIGRWYAGLAKGRYDVPAALKARYPELLAGAKSATDTLRGLQRYVAQDIRYVSISLGIGGYQPRTPAEVFSTGYGDCKDKATLFVALATSLGYKAFPVLLNAGGEVVRATPSIEQFDHAIAVVEHGGRRTFTDLTTDLTPFGELPPSDQGQFALVVHPDGRTEEVTLPDVEPADNLQAIALTGELSPDGLLSGTYTERSTGSRQYGLRNLFTAPLDSTRRADMARGIVTSLYPGATADSFQTFDGRDLTADTRVAVRLSGGRAARLTGAGGRTAILQLPFGSMRSMADAATALEAQGERTYPIDAEKILGVWANTNTFTLTLPAGWQAQLPPAVEARSKWGTYIARYQQDGRTLRLERRLEGARGIYPPEELYDLTSWLRAVAKDDTPYLVIETGARP